MANEQADFTRGLDTIRNTAALKQKTVTVADILAAFPGRELSSEQIGMIYAFLEQEGITLSDYVPHDTQSMNLGGDYDRLFGEPEAADPEEEKLYEFYLEDLEGIKPLSTEEENALREQLLHGTQAAQKAAKERLTEGNLRFVVQQAKKQSGKGASLNDLIQEGNMALFMALEDYDGSDDLADHLEKSVKNALKALIREETGYERAEERMTVEANRILEATKEMEEEEGRAITAEELSARLGIPAARVDEVLRESAKAIRNMEH